MSYLGFKDYEEFYTDIICTNSDVDLYYSDQHYMITSEWLGSRKNKVEKKCFSYQDCEYEEYLEKMQVYDSWEELLEKAFFQDGVKLKDVADKI